MSEADGTATLRLDKFLWFARLAKTRSLAARLCAAGAVAIAGHTVLKPGQRVRIGDVVTVPQGRMIRTVRIVALGSRRGPPAEAQLLYTEQAPPQPIARAAWTSLLAEESEAALETLSLGERAG
jgi:ribosome-associated heat shock protein Hsp15